MPDEMPELRRFAVEARWVDMETLPVLLVNQAVGQVNEGEIILTFGRVVPPPVLGTGDEKAAQVEALGVLPIIPVVRMTMTIERLRAFRDTLDETIAINERQAAMLGEEEKHVGDVGEDAPS